MSTSCLTCLSDHDLVAISGKEWNILDFILQSSIERVSDPGKIYLEELKSSDAGKICMECWYAVQSVDTFLKSARASFKTLVDTWNNERGPSTSNPIDNVDPLATEELHLKIESYEGDDNEVSIKKEDSITSECVIDIAPSSPSTMSVNSDGMKQEPLESDVESELLNPDVEMQIDPVMHKNPVKALLQPKGPQLQEVRVVAVRGPPTIAKQTRPQMRVVPVTYVKTTGSNPVRLVNRSRPVRVVAVPNAGNAKKGTGSPLQTVRGTSISIPSGSLQPTGEDGFKLSPPRNPVVKNIQSRVSTDASGATFRAVPDTFTSQQESPDFSPVPTAGASQKRPAKSTPKTKNEISEAAKLRKRLERQKIKNDPIRHEEYKQKERQRYLKRKREKKILPINELPPARKRIQRKRNRDNVRAHYRRQKEKALETNE